MKLFKKLAAVALAAVLALSMVGCGATADIKSEINDYIADISALGDRNIIHKDDLDAVAAKLMAAADAASATADEEEQDVIDLLKDEEVQAAAGITEPAGYYYNIEQNYAFKSELLNKSKIERLVDDLMDDSWNLETGNGSSMYRNFEYGIAVGKINGQEYVLMIKVPTK